MKRCSKCGKLKEFTDFYKAKVAKDGHRSECRKCSSEAERKYRLKMNIYLQQFQDKKCSCYLGIAVAERLCSHLFQDVVRMPNNNPGFDFICAKDKKIDVKSACIKVHQNKKYPHWGFHIKKNTMADYFLLLAFNNRDDLEPQHLWLIPGPVLNHLMNTGVSPSTVGKWDEYKQQMDSVLNCCSEMRDKLEHVI